MRFAGDNQTAIKTLARFITPNGDLLNVAEAKPAEFQRHIAKGIAHLEILYSPVWRFLLGTLDKP